jgi:ketosteroid isomerase-like protein
MISAAPTHSEPRSDYEDLGDMSLDPAQLADLIHTGGECVFGWTTRTGDPMGVVVTYLHRGGKFWTTSVATRARVRALWARPQSTIVLNTAGHSATFKGGSVLHRPGDHDWAAIKGWFFPAHAGTDRQPDDPLALQVERSLDTPHQVIVQTSADLVVSFDFTKLSGPTVDNRANLAAAYGAFGAGDVQPILELLHDDIVWRATGDSPIAGVYTGKDRVLEFFTKTEELYDGTLRLDVGALFADEQHGIVVTTERAAHRGEEFAYTSTHVVTFDRGKITRFLALQDDEYHKFWAHHRPRKTLNRWSGTSQ